MEEADYNLEVFCCHVYELYTNTYFIKDAQKDYDLKEVEHIPLTEEDKKSILSYLTSISDKIPNISIVKPLYVIEAYNFLLEERRKHIDSDFDFIPDYFIQMCCKRCKNFEYYQYDIPVYGALFRDFKETCKTPGQMPKIVREMHTPDRWIYDNFYGLIKSDGTYTLAGTGLYFK